MPKEKMDRRSLYSQRIIRESLYDLMKEKPINKITVTEICEKADVNRSTFYAYFTDIYDLHQKIIKEFFALQKTVIKHIKKLLIERNDIKEVSYMDYYNILYYYLTTVKDNCDLYKFIFNQNSTTAIHNSFGKVLYHTLKELLSPIIDERFSEDFKKAFTFVSGGTTALFTKWIERNCDSSIEDLAKNIAGYCYGTFNAYGIIIKQNKEEIKNYKPD